MKKILVTISRQYGSGGREIGEKTAELLGIPCYDKEIIHDAAEKGNLDAKMIAHSEETAASSLLYTLAMGSNVLDSAMSFGYKMPINDKLFLLQSDVIRSYAKAGSAVIIGRCADYVLRDEACLLRVFIYGDLAHRQERVASRHPELRPAQIIDVISKTDHRRSSYYNFYTGKKWGRFESYDLALNSSSLGIDGAAKIIAEAVQALTKENE